MHTDKRFLARFLGAVEAFFGTWRFAAFGICLLGFFNLLVLGVLLFPSDGSPLASFAAEFRQWCFGYDPATGRMDWSYVVTFFSSTLVLLGIFVAIWGGALRTQWREGGLWVFVPYVVVTLCLVCGCAGGFGLLYKPPVKGELPFPAESLRTQYRPPALVLVNQHKQRVALSSYQGKVVLVTAVYATCGYTCPMIFAQTKRALAQLTAAQRKDLGVLGITLDPQRDRPEVLLRLAKAQRIQAPGFQLLTGEAKQVNEVLDRFGFARKRNAKTGVIDHANLFILIDRQGKIAYRFTLGKRQEKWLVQALRLLLWEVRSRI